MFFLKTKNATSVGLRSWISKIWLLIIMHSPTSALQNPNTKTYFGIKWIITYDNYIDVDDIRNNNNDEIDDKKHPAKI